jgi:hypothetical protein
MSSGAEVTAEEPPDPDADAQHGRLPVARDVEDRDEEVVFMMLK